MKVLQITEQSYDFFFLILFSLPMILRIASLIQPRSYIECNRETKVPTLCWGLCFSKVSTRGSRQNNTKITRLLYFENYSYTRVIFMLLYAQQQQQ
jgi:hypothetical protein